MKNEQQDQEFHRAFAELQHESSTELPTVEALTALRDGTCSDAEAERLLDSVAGDATATRLMLDAKRFPEFEPTAEEQAAIRALPKDGGWQSLRGQLAEEGHIEPTVREMRSDPAATVAAIDISHRRRNLYEFLAVAAALLIGIGLGLSWPRGEMAPIVNPAVVELTAGTERAGNEPPQLVQWSPRGLAIVIDVTEFAASAGPFEMWLVSEDPAAKPQSLPVDAAEEQRYLDTVQVVWPELPTPGRYLVELRRGGEVLAQRRIEVTD